MMTYEEAKRILHPDTTWEALAEIGFLAGFKSKEKVQEEVDEACLVACEALEKQIPMKPTCLNRTQHFENCDVVLCPRCKKRLKMKSKGKYCDKCGGALDWSDDNGEA